MTNDRIKIENLWHKYRSTPMADWSLRSIDMTLRPGELIGLVGPSGCGKTTLLRLIAGFERPTRGFISIDSQPIASPDRLIPPERRGVGMVFQDYALFPHLDAWQNVCFGLKRGQDKHRAIALLELLGISELRFRYPHELSGGQKQRLALARALAPGTSLVLLDEPFSNLDVDVRQRLRSELSNVLKSCSASAILVTHDPHEALAICDRVAVMCEGALHQCSSPSELVNHPASSFVGRFVLQRNVFDVESNGHQLSTPLGLINRPSDIDMSKTTELMFDEKGLLVKKNPSGGATIQGREYQGNHWLLRVQFNNQILRVWHPIDQPVNVGDRCSLAFNSNNKGILFPGSIACNLC